MSDSLRSLSNHDILSRTHDLVARERGLTLLVLLHLNEIERRRLHLEHAYKSMFDYCTSGLGYSASAALRRIRTARCIARFPEVYALLQSNEVNLSTISQVSKVLTVANRAEVLRRIRGRSQREVEAIVAEYEPRAALPPDRVRTIVVLDARPVASEVNAGERCGGVLATRCPNTEGGTAAAKAVESDTAKMYDRCGCNSDMVSPPPATWMERRALIQFSASEDFMAKVEKVRSIAWHRLPMSASFEQVFELALDLFIERESHEARHERRRMKRTETKVALAVSSAPGGRYVPEGIRDLVFTRDHGQCTYNGESGRPCSSTTALQVDHIVPVARGGASTPDNLRLLCAYHNRLEAERVIGRSAKHALVCPSA